MASGVFRVEPLQNADEVASRTAVTQSRRVRLALLKSSPAPGCPDCRGREPPPPAQPSVVAGRAGHVSERLLSRHVVLHDPLHGRDVVGHEQRRAIGQPERDRDSCRRQHSPRDLTQDGQPTPQPTDPGDRLLPEHGHHQQRHGDPQANAAVGRRPHGSRSGWPPRPRSPQAPVPRTGQTRAPAPPRIRPPMRPGAAGRDPGGRTESVPLPREARADPPPRSRGRRSRGCAATRTAGSTGDQPTASSVTAAKVPTRPVTTRYGRLRAGTASVVPSPGRPDAASNPGSTGSTQGDSPVTRPATSPIATRPPRSHYPPKTVVRTASLLTGVLRRRVAVCGPGAIRASDKRWCATHARCRRTGPSEVRRDGLVSHPRVHGGRPATAEVGSSRHFITDSAPQDWVELRWIGHGQDAEPRAARHQEPRTVSGPRPLRSRSPHLSPPAEQGIGLIEGRDRARKFSGVEYTCKLPLRLADVLADHPGEVDAVEVHPHCRGQLGGRPAAIGLVPSADQRHDPGVMAFQGSSLDFRDQLLARLTSDHGAMEQASVARRDEVGCGEPFPEQPRGKGDHKAAEKRRGESATLGNFNNMASIETLSTYNDFHVGPPRGFEPRTYALRVRCSTTELRRPASRVVPCGLRRKPAHATRGEVRPRTALRPGAWSRPGT